VSFVEVSFDRMGLLRPILAVAIALAACSAEDESLGRKSGAASNDGAASACTAPNPQGCNMTGCPRGQYCYPTPNDPTSPKCTPSSCSCNARTGTWDCTFDCGGGVCLYPDDAAPVPRGDGGKG
jgi:hypothetical protein